MKKRLVYLISHGHTARGLFQTSLLQKLVGASYEVFVVSKPGTEEIIKDVVAGQGAKLEHFDAHGGHRAFQRTLFRGFVHQNIRKNPALFEKYKRALLDPSVGMKRRFLHRFYFVLGAIIRNFLPLKFLYRKMEYAAYKNERAIEILTRLQPSAVISTRPVDGMEAEMLNAASRLGIHKVMYILSWDNITSKGIFPELADSFLTWGPLMNEELEEYYNVAEASLYLTGVTHFDVHADVRDNPERGDKWITSLGLDHRKPYLFFTMSASLYAPTEIDIIEAIALDIKNDIYGEDMQLIIRPHMLNFMERTSDLSWKDRLIALQSARVGVDFPVMDNTLLTWYMDEKDMKKLSFLIKGSSVCLNSGSTLSIEAVAFDKPVILTAFDSEPQPAWKSATRLKDYIHLAKFLSFNACDVAASLEDLSEKIKENLKTPEGRQSERRKVLEAECYKVDGLSTDRFVENIDTILAKLE